MTRPHFLTSDDAAAYVGCSAKTLGRIRRDGKLHYYMVAGKLRYTQADCDAYLDSCRVTVQPVALTGGTGRRTARVITLHPRFSQVHG